MFTHNHIKIKGVTIYVTPLFVGPAGLEPATL